MADLTFTVPESAGGKTLADLQKSSGLAFRPDVLGGMLGVSGPLTAGQSFTADVSDIGSAEVQALSGLFGAGISPVEYARQQAFKQQQEAIRPAIESLEASIPETSAAFAQRGESLRGEKETMSERYARTLEDIKGRRDVEQKKAEVASAREFGKRGISTQSGMFDQFLQERLDPLFQTFGEIETRTTNTFEDLLRQIGGQIAEIPTEEALSIRNVRNAIAQLQAGAGKDAITQALAMAQFEAQQENREFDEMLALRQQEFAEREDGEQTPLQFFSKGGQIVGVDPFTGQPVNQFAFGGGSGDGSIFTNNTPTPTPTTTGGGFQSYPTNTGGLSIYDPTRTEGLTFQSTSDLQRILGITGDEANTA